MEQKNMVLLAVGMAIAVATVVSYAAATSPSINAYTQTASIAGPADSWQNPQGSVPNGVWSPGQNGAGMTNPQGPWRGGMGMMGGMMGPGMMGSMMGPSMMQSMMGGYGWNGPSDVTTQMNGGGYAGSTEPVATNQIYIQNYAFNPAVITVQKGTTVTWTNRDRVAHTVTSNIFNSGYLNSGQSFSYTFNQPGTYTYFCQPHPYMRGTVVVQG